MTLYSSRTFSPPKAAPKRPKSRFERPMKPTACAVSEKPEKEEIITQTEEDRTAITYAEKVRKVQRLIESLT